MSRAPVVAIVGRANVGKSTLVNRLLGRRAAIEHPDPGVTRDRSAYEGSWEGVRFALVDTGGWEPRARGLAAKVAAQAERAAREADLILFVVDVQTGATADDLGVAKGLRRAPVPVVLVANKVDTAAREHELYELDRLGLGSAVPMSALHGRGSGDLLDLVVAHVGALAPDRKEEGLAPTAVAIVGRPNVGKSSLFNRLVGDERSIVDEAPGTTRDSVDTIVELDGRRYRFIDTAGMRRRAKEAQGPEYYGLVRSLRAIDAAEAVLHVIDAAGGTTEQDQRIARRVAEAGRAAVLVLNKWDLVPAERAEEAPREIRDALRFVSWAPVVRTSALTGRGVGRIPSALATVRESWARRVPTATLNAWVRDAVERVPLGAGPRGRPTKIRYLTQARACPPTFVLFASGRISEAALRAIERRLRQRFDFAGTPLRLAVRTPRRRAG